MAGVNLILNYILISNLGIWGAVYATFGSILFKIIALHHYGQKFFYIPFEWWRMLKMLLIAIIIYLISKYIRSENLWLSLTWDSILIITYPIILWMTNTINKSEKKGIVEMVSKIYNKYILSKANIN